MDRPGPVPMFISRYTRMDTTIKPGSFLSVVYVSDGDGDGEDIDDVVQKIRADVDSIDGVAVHSGNADPLRIKDLYKLLKRLKLPKRYLLLTTDGRGYGELDDLVGAGYINYVNLMVDGPLDKSQTECVKMLDECGCPYMVTVRMIPGRASGSSLKELASEIKNSKHLMLRVERNQNPAKKFTESELISLAESVKGAAKDVRIVRM